MGGSRRLRSLALGLVLFLAGGLVAVLPATGAPAATTTYVFPGWSIISFTPYSLNPQLGWQANIDIHVTPGTTAGLLQIEWGPDTNYGNTTCNDQISPPAELACAIGYLQPSTVYHFRLNYRQDTYLGLILASTADQIVTAPAATTTTTTTTTPTTTTSPPTPSTTSSTPTTPGRTSVADTTTDNTGPRPPPASGAPTGGTTTGPPFLGHTVLLARRSQTSHCTRGVLPDRQCSPGAHYSGLTKAVLCSPTFRTGTVPSVTDSEKHQVEVEYGMTPKAYGRTVEIDHIVSLEIGGSHDIANLYPEPGSGLANYHVKDKLENKLHKRVCDGSMTLHAAQTGIARNWERLYKTVFGVSP